MTNDIKNSVFQKGIKIEGDLSLEGDVDICGDIKGDVVSKGCIEINDGGSVIGNVSCKELKFTSGSIIGNVTVDTQLEVNNGSKIEGNVETSSGIISGIVIGNIAVTTTLEIKKTAEIKGDLQAQDLSVEMGARLIGNVSVKPKDMPIEDGYSNYTFNQEDSEDSKEEEEEDLGKDDVNEEDAGKDEEDSPLYF